MRSGPLSWHADQLDDLLQKEFGGKRMFDEGEATKPHRVQAQTRLTSRRTYTRSPRLPLGGLDTGLHAYL